MVSLTDRIVGKYRGELAGNLISNELIARAEGCSAATVYFARKIVRKGDQIKRGFSGKVAKARDLGKVPDGVIAKRIGCTAKTVWYVRKVLGVPAFVAPGRKTKKKPRRKPRIRKWLESNIKLLGVLPDAEVAKMAGTSPSYVCVFRRERGIPFAPAGVKGAKLHLERSQELTHFAETVLEMGSNDFGFSPKVTARIIEVAAAQA